MVDIPDNCEPSPTYDPEKEPEIWFALNMFNDASDPDTITFFQFGILLQLCIMVSYIYMPYISLLPSQANNTVYLI